MVKVGKVLQIRIDDDQRAALESLSERSGHSIAALIRWCIKNSLPLLAGNIEKQICDERTRVPNESTIDAPPKP
jgi:hypothetical protein